MGNKHNKAAFVEANKTESGGCTKDFLKTIGVEWPPKKDGRKNLLKIQKESCRKCN